MSTVPTAGNFLNDQKCYFRSERAAKVAGTYVSGPPFIHPGFLEGLRHPGLLSANKA